MTDNEIRIAIAESQGRKVCKHSPAYWKHVGPEGDIELFCDACNEYLDEVTSHPNYPSDLNAMHEVEETITNSHERQMYMGYLGNNFDMTEDEQWSYLHATARQRAEAYLRTKGIWKDQPDPKTKG